MLAGHERRLAYTLSKNIYDKLRLSCPQHPLQLHEDLCLQESEKKE